MLTWALLRIVKRAGDDKAVIAAITKAGAMEIEHSWIFYPPPLGTVTLFLSSLVHPYNT